MQPKQTIASTSKVPSTPAAPIVAQTPAAPAPATPSPASAAALPSTPTPAPANTSSAAAGSRQFNDPSPLMLGGERQAALANMEAMGFPRAECERALRAAFFNPDRAVEYLLTVSHACSPLFHPIFIVITGNSRKRTTAALGWCSNPHITRPNARRGSAYSHLSGTRHDRRSRRPR